MNSSTSRTSIEALSLCIEGVRCAATERQGWAARSEKSVVTGKRTAGRTC